MLLSATIQYVKVFCCYTYSKYYAHYGSNKESCLILWTKGLRISIIILHHCIWLNLFILKRQACSWLILSSYKVIIFCPSINKLRFLQETKSLQVLFASKEVAVALSYQRLQLLFYVDKKPLSSSLVAFEYTLVGCKTDRLFGLHRPPSSSSNGL